jgi:hypothetical protein
MPNAAAKKFSMSNKDIFVDTVIPDCERLVAAAEARRVDDIANALHRIKGVMLYLNAPDAIHLIASMERTFLSRTIVGQARRLCAQVRSERFLQHHFGPPEG